jgi:hypothetical protein
MEAKKYIDFDPGVYDTTKIFLQADPVTGALEKVNLPVTGAGTSRLATGEFNKGNVGSMETDILNYTIPANTLVNEGDILSCYLYYSNVTSTQAKKQWFYFNGISFMTYSDTSVANFNVWLRIWRTSASTAYFSGHVMRTSSNLFPSSGTFIDVDFTAPIVFRSTFTATTTDAMLSRLAILSFESAV